MCCFGKLLPRTCDCSTRKPVFMSTKAGQQLLVSHVGDGHWEGEVRQIWKSPAQSRRAVAFQREWKGFFGSVQLGTGHQPAALLAQGTLDGPQPHSQSGGSVCGSGIRHPWLTFLLRNTLITPTPQSLTPKVVGWEG